MNNQEIATNLIVEISKLFIEFMQSMNVGWTRAFLRFQMAAENHFGSNGSYETDEGVSLISAVKYNKLFDAVNSLGPKLREASAMQNKKFCVLLVTVDNNFNFKVDYEYSNPERWKITKLNGSSGLPEGLQ